MILFSSSNSSLSRVSYLLVKVLCQAPRWGFRNRAWRNRVPTRERYGATVVYQCCSSRKCGNRPCDWCPTGDSTMQWYVLVAVVPDGFPALYWCCRPYSETHISLFSSLLRQTNWREVSSLVRLYQTSGSGKPLITYKHETIHAKKGMNHSLAYSRDEMYQISMFGEQELKAQIFMLLLYFILS